MVPPVASLQVRAAARRIGTRFLCTSKSILSLTFTDAPEGTMRRLIVLTTVLVGCAHPPVSGTPLTLKDPIFILDGHVVSCQVRAPSPADTGCAAAALIPGAPPRLLPDSEAVKFLGYSARVYVASRSGEGPVRLQLYVVNGKRHVCLTTTRMSLGRPSPFLCPPLEELDPKKIVSVEIVKGRAVQDVFGKDWESGVIVIRTRQ